MNYPEMRKKLQIHIPLMISDIDHSRAVGLRRIGRILQQLRLQEAWAFRFPGLGRKNPEYLGRYSVRTLLSF